MVAEFCVVVSFAKNALNSGDFCGLLALDIKNTFNFINWGRINGALADSIGCLTSLVEHYLWCRTNGGPREYIVTTLSFIMEWMIWRPDGSCFSKTLRRCGGLRDKESDSNIDLTGKGVLTFQNEKTEVVLIVCNSLCGVMRLMLLYVSPVWVEPLSNFQRKKQMNSVDRLMVCSDCRVMPNEASRRMKCVCYTMQDVWKDT